jgi:hypothetical protein
MSAMGLVLDHDYGAGLDWLSKGMHTWAIDSLCNRTAAEAIWAARSGHDPEGSLTLFERLPEEATSDLISRVLAEMVRQHGMNGPGLLYLVIAVLGCPLSDEVRARFSDFGFGDLSFGPAGLVARQTTVAAQGAIRLPLASAQKNINIIYDNLSGYGNLDPIALTVRKTISGDRPA